MDRIAVIADLVASRKIKDRARTQELLQHVLDDLNKRSRPELLSPYTLTLGDEFQAVFKGADTMFRDAFTVLGALYPVRIRFSFGLGTIETRINRRQAIGMDGPAFYNARKGMETLKDEGGLFCLEGVDGHFAKLLQESLSLVGHSCQKWSASRLEIFNLLFGGMTVKAMTERLEITDKAIYKSINHGALRTTLSLLQEIAGLIDRQLKPE